MKFSKFRFLLMICPIPSHLSPSRHQLYHHLRTQRYVIPLNPSMPWSRVNTEYSIHWVQHTQSTAYTEYCIHCGLHHPKIDCLPLPASVSWLGRPCCTQISTFPQLWVNQWMESQLPSRLPPDWPPPSTPPISLDHGLPVHLQCSSITASKFALT